MADDNLITQGPITAGVFDTTSPLDKQALADTILTDIGNGRIPQSEGTDKQDSYFGGDPTQQQERIYSDPTKEPTKPEQQPDKKNQVQQSGGRPAKPQAPEAIEKGESQSNKELKSLLENTVYFNKMQSDALAAQTAASQEQNVLENSIYANQLKTQEQFQERRNKLLEKQLEAKNNFINYLYYERDDLGNQFEYSKIDPYRFYNSKTTVEKLGLIMSMIGASLAGKEDFVYSMLKNTIQNDILAQKLNFEIDYKMYQDERAFNMSIYSKMLDKFGDAQKALDGAYNNSMKQFETAIKLAQANAKTKTEAARYQETAAKIKEELAHKTNELYLKNEMDVPPNEIVHKNEINTRNRANRAIRLFDDLYTYAFSESDAKKAKELSSVYTDIFGLYERYIELSKKTPFLSTLAGKGKGRLQSAWAELFIQLKEAGNFGGALTHNEIEFIRSKVPEVFGFKATAGAFTGNFSARLKESFDEMKRSYIRKLEGVTQLRLKDKLDYFINFREY